MVAIIVGNPFGVWWVKIFLGSFITEMMTIGATSSAKEFNPPNPAKKLRYTAKRYCSLMYIFVVHLQIL